jgi:predicted Zn finger-like uncharacterized protein
MLIMNSRCPTCKTTFRVTAEQLAQADGKVRCGQCENIFNARDHKVHGVPGNPPPTVSPDFFKRMLQGRPQLNKRNKKATIAWSAGIVVTVLMLALQLAYMQRSRLAAHERLQPFIADICARIPSCTLPPKRDLSRIQLISRNVYSHPNIDGVLIVNAVITNSAGFNQPYPVLLISMSNVRGQVVAERHFRPEEYLSAAPDQAAGMESGKAVAVSLTVMDPGHDAMAFELDFL